jgi:16S rRNA (cytosine967-C5)-methyltransferase
MINVRFEAYKIIVKVIHKNIFSDKLLTQMTKKIRESGKDANFLYALVKGVIKMQENLDYIVSEYVDADKYSRTSKKVKILLYMAIYQLRYMKKVPDHAAVHETVEEAKKLFDIRIANFINAVLRSYLRNSEIIYPEDTIERLSKFYSFPAEMIIKWIEYWGEENTELLCLYFNETPQLNIRINNMATDKKKLLEYFQRRDIKLSQTSASDNILKTENIQEVLRDIALEEGYFSVQDPSAALVVELADPQSDENILDLFAAPGGKATYAAEIMHNTGEIIAVDKFPGKVKKMKSNVSRLKISNMKLIKEDAFNYGPVAAAYDRVFLDVPCSGWGVLQKKAELRWQKNQDLDKLLKLQKDALKTGASFVRPGGFLIYSTCTLNVEENETQVENFLKKNKAFKLVSADDFIKKEFTENGYLKTIPFKHYTDGAFAAKMQKVL